MKITITPTCRHENGWSDHGEPLTGSTLYVDTSAVMLDGHVVIRRDLRPKARREPGHGWLDAQRKPWTGFTIDAEPNERSPR